MVDPINALIESIQNGETGLFASLLAQYEPLLKKQVEHAAENAVGLLPEDLYQESAIALYDAARSYDLQAEDVTFGLYAKICIRNRLISVLRKYTENVVQTTAEVDGALAAYDFHASPEQMACDRDSFDLLMRQIQSTLTSFEAAVFSLYIQNKSYREIAVALCATEKSVDNAICRIKAKVKKLI